MATRFKTLATSVGVRVVARCFRLFRFSYSGSFVFVELTSSCCLNGRSCGVNRGTVAKKKEKNVSSLDQSTMQSLAFALWYGWNASSSRTQAVALFVSSDVFVAETVTYFATLFLFVEGEGGGGWGGRAGSMTGVWSWRQGVGKLCPGNIVAVQVIKKNKNKRRRRST